MPSWAVRIGLPAPGLKIRIAFLTLVRSRRSAPSRGLSMSSPIWTPAALSSEVLRYEDHGWRLVEAQHRVSTLKLVDSLTEQRLLEELIEETKPAFPPECRHLDYLLATPFRYGAEYPRGSRFRRAGRTLGVFYASEEPETAIAEMAFLRVLFFSESPATPWPSEVAEYTAFS